MLKIKCKLDIQSINNAIGELQAYRKGLEARLASLVDKLLQDGITVANAWIMAAQGDSEKPYVDYHMDSSGNIVKAEIFMEGEDALFIEFGAGIYYNNGNNHPLAAELGYGIGTYPSDHPPNRAINPGYWYYRKDGTVQLSLGTEATFPMYHAAETMRNNLIKKAIEEFVSR